MWARMACAAAMCGMAGCAGSGGGKVSAGDAFQEMALRALNDDKAYLRQHITADALERARQEWGVDEQQTLERLARQLERSKVLETVAASGGADRSVVRVAANPMKPSDPPGEYRIDLVHDKDRGWMLASPPYDYKPMKMGN